MARKKRSNKPYLLVSAIIVVSIGAALFLFNYYMHRPKFKHYAGFGIDLPVNYSIHGIDISKHQSLINWEDVKLMNVEGVQIDFVFMKATEGLDLVDKQFRRNWNEADKQQIPKGAYHFFNASKNGHAQAMSFLRTVELSPGDLRPVLDVETINATSRAQLQVRVQDWLDAVEKKIGVKPIIYTNADFYKNYLAGKFDEYPLWVAHYLVKDKPRISREWHFWQHSETGKVNGINANVDFNVFNGDSVSFEELRLK